MQPMLRRLNAAAARRPLLASLIATGAKASAADAIVQLALERRGALDRRRNAAFAAFGFAYQGGFQYFLVNVVVERLAPGKAALAVLKKVLLMNFVCDPLLFFPAFYTMREAMATQALDGSTVTAALAKYRANCWADWRTTWSIWLAGHAVTWGIMPRHLRMPWVAGLSFAYVAVLSATRGDLAVHPLSASTAAPAAVKWPREAPSNTTSSEGQDVEHQPGPAAGASSAAGTGARGAPEQTAREQREQRADVDVSTCAELVAACASGGAVTIAEGARIELADALDVAVDVTISCGCGGSGGGGGGGGGRGGGGGGGAILGRRVLVRHGAALTLKGIDIARGSGVYAVGPGTTLRMEDVAVLSRYLLKDPCCEFLK